jgi:hypothetical protein
MARRDYYRELSKQLGLSAGAQVRTERQATGDNAKAPMTKANMALLSEDDSLCPWSWYLPNLCWCVGDWCAQHPYRTGVDNITKYDQNWIHTTVCSYRGTVRNLTSYRTWWSWTTAMDVYLVAGTYSWWYHDNSLLDFDACTRVEDADGDGYHQCGTGW